VTPPRSGPAGTGSGRRQFPARYKLAILDEYDLADREGRSAILRREHLRASLISQWRRQRTEAALAGMFTEPGGQPAWKVHASHVLMEDFTAVAQELGFRGPGHLVRAYMHYMTGRSDALPQRPAQRGNDAKPTGTAAPQSSE
jgi:transposase-like protein